MTGLLKWDVRVTFPDLYYFHSFASQYWIRFWSSPVRFQIIATIAHHLQHTHMHSCSRLWPCLYPAFSLHALTQTLSSTLTCDQADFTEVTHNYTIYSTDTYTRSVSDLHTCTRNSSMTILGKTRFMHKPAETTTPHVYPHVQMSCTHKRIYVNKDEQVEISPESHGHLHQRLGLGSHNDQNRVAAICRLSW